VAEEPPRAQQADDEDRQQQHGPKAMPGVQVAVAEVGQEAGEPGGAADRKQPPGPGLPLAEREQHQVGVQDANREQRTAERGPVVDHELHDPAARDRAQVGGGHAEIGDVVGEELAACGQEDREPAGKDEAACGGKQQQDAVADDRLKEPTTPRCRFDPACLVSVHDPTLDLVALSAPPHEGTSLPGSASSPVTGRTSGHPLSL
jgi:hypothetical protein